VEDWLGADSGWQIAGLARRYDFAAEVAMAVGMAGSDSGFAMRSSRDELDS
jgi:hypothetical protein